MHTFDFILFSYDKGLINENDFLLLCRSYISQDLDFPLSCFLLAIEPPVIPATKQNELNTDKKLDRVFIQSDKSENKQLSVLIKYI